MSALKKNGVQVHLLPASERWPDSLFVEDPALVFPQGAIVLRSIRAERAGERDLIEPVLRSKFAKVLEIDNG
ncbi:MAG: dimethylarginine dimethylaminohydrolase, partial [Rhodospirillaceae bacterium]|nr:dimethylarginine dimethylaminohydrolase [Rhodospirillaceae bacterium]